MIGKIIVSAPDRKQCLTRLEHALNETVVEGVNTTIALHKRIVQWPAFRDGTYDTTSLERELVRS
jgi:acetyl-CoA carboxylase biotin carboxylase subunit